MTHVITYDVTLTINTMGYIMDNITFNKSLHDIKLQMFNLFEAMTFSSALEEFDTPGFRDFLMATWKSEGWHITLYETFNTSFSNLSFNDLDGMAMEMASTLISEYTQDESEAE